MRSIPIIIVLLIILPVFSLARTINVPEDFELIQAAIDTSENGDTVLVTRGVYQTRVNFEGKLITLASRFLFTRDRRDIDSTIIDARGEGSVVRFDSGEDENARLIGFTLKRGRGSPDIGGTPAGGGIHCLRSSPTLEKLIITQCWAQVGGGIFAQIASPTISDVIFRYNQGSQSGGAIYCSREGANPIIRRVIIYGTQFGTWGQAIGCYMGARPVMENSTIIATGQYPIALYHDNYLRMVNCTITSDQPGNLGWDGGRDTLVLEYCHTNTGPDGFIIRGGHLIYGEGNVVGDVEFFDTSRADFRPRWDNFPDEDESMSILIDAGHPDFPEDADGSRSDIGAAAYRRGCFVMGRVSSRLSGVALAEVSVTSSNGGYDTTDADGFYQLNEQPSDRFTVTFSLAGFLDSTTAQIEMEVLDTMVINIQLLGPVLEIDEELFTVNLRESETSDHQLAMTNRGTGRFDFQAEARGRGEFGVDPGELRRSYPAEEITGNNRLRCMSFVDDSLYLFGGRVEGQGDSNWAYVLDREGNLVRSFTQFDVGARSLGYKSITWDGEKFWTVKDTAAWSFSRNGEEISTINFHIPAFTAANIAWDPDREAFWISALTSSNTYCIDNEGQLLSTLPRNGLRHHGLAYLPDDPDGYSLYISSSSAPNEWTIYRMHPMTGDTILFSRKVEEENSTRSGLFLTSDFDPFGNVVGLTLTRTDLEIHQIWLNRTWAIVSESEGSINPGENQSITLTIDAEDLVPEVYPGEVRIYHNAPGFLTAIPFEVTVTPLSVPSDFEASFSPFAFHLSPPYPSPFNSSVTISYSIGGGQAFLPVTLRIYDLSGRLVVDLTPNPKAQSPRPKAQGLKPNWSGTHLTCRRVSI